MNKIVLLSFRGLLFCAACFIVLLNYRPNVPYLETHSYGSGIALKSGGLQVQFIGNTNVLLWDDTSAILTDGFFTRPSLTQFLWGEIEPDRDIIENSLEQAGIENLDAVIPIHSHFDHAMDSPIVAQMTGAKLVGSESTMNIGRGLGFPEDQMVVVESGVPIQFSSMNVTLIKGMHLPYPDEAMGELLLNQEILRPIKPPASAMDYKEGASYTIIVKHPEATIAIHGSAGFVPDILNDYDVDILFLGIAGLETMDQTYNHDFQTHVIGALEPEVIIPIHWDDFFITLNKGLKSRSFLERIMWRLDLNKAFSLIEEKNSEKKIVILPLWQNISVHSL